MHCKLNQRNMANPGPYFCSRVFSLHNEKLFSMAFTKEPCPDLVMYLVVYSIMPVFVNVACCNPGVRHLQSRSSELPKAARVQRVRASRAC